MNDSNNPGYHNGNQADGAAGTRAATYQCPNCNGVLSFDARSGKLVCEHCGSSFEDGMHKEAQIPVGQGAAAKKDLGHVRDVQGFLNRTTWGGTSAEDLAGATSYSCPSCGASVTADQSVVATDCPYCGNNMLVSGIATPENVPSLVLPFSVSKADAEAQMKKHFEHKWYLSRKFDASLEHMRGVYVPYHLYDMQASGRADYIGYYDVDTDDDHSTRYYYAVQRAGRAAFRRIPVDGSSKMPDGHMDAISPFGFDKMKPFSPGYVSGYLMEVPDESARQCMPRAEERARNSLMSGLESDARRENGVEGISETVSSSADVKCTGFESCALPVWLMHCTWGEEQMLFAVNGETGKCVGDLPVDAKRRIATCIASALLALVVCVLGIAILTDGGSDGDNLVEFCIGAAILTGLATLLVDRHFMSQMHTAVEAGDANASLSGPGVEVTYRWRSRKSYGTASRARRVFSEGEKQGFFGRGADRPGPLGVEGTGTLQRNAHRSGRQ